MSKEAVADERLKRLVPKAGDVLTYLSQDVPQVQFAAKMGRRLRSPRRSPRSGSSVRHGTWWCAR